MRCCAVLVSGGRGARFGGSTPKQYLSVCSQPVWLWALEAFERCTAVTDVVVVVAEDYVQEVTQHLRRRGAPKVMAVCQGGAERIDSVRAGIEATPPGTQLVAIHDAARPLVTPELIQRVIRAAAPSGAALPGVPVPDTVKQVEQKTVRATVDRRALFLAQTPQVVDKELWLRAYAHWQGSGEPVTDDVQLVERLGQQVHLVVGDPQNFKITLPEDLARASWALQQRGNEREKTTQGEIAVHQALPRTGMGHDVHRLVMGRPLILGGVTIPFERGLLGHSDADVLAHAVGDALLGAVALGDLGAHFSPDDPQYAGADSLELLRRIVHLVAGAGFQVGNVDAVVICQRPKLAPHIPLMRQRLAAALEVSQDQVSVKATTTEGLGFAGQGQGIAAYATVLVVPGTKAGARTNDPGAAAAAGAEQTGSDDIGTDDTGSDGSPAL